MEAMTPKQLGPGEGHVVRLLGEPRTFKVTPTQNGGTYFQFETSHAPGTGAPAHFLHGEDEAFYVLGGRYEFIIGEKRFVATAGSFVFAPRGVVHGFTNTGDETARMLVTVTPGMQHEAFFREADELAGRLGKQPELSELIPIALKHGWVMAPG